MYRCRWRRLFPRLTNQPWIKQTPTDLFPIHWKQAKYLPMAWSTSTKRVLSRLGLPTGAYRGMFRVYPRIHALRRARVCWKIQARFRASRKCRSMRRLPDVGSSIGVLWPRFEMLQINERKGGCRGLCPIYTCICECKLYECVLRFILCYNVCDNVSMRVLFLLS